MISRRKMVAFLGFCGLGTNIKAAHITPQKPWYEMDYIDAVWYRIGESQRSTFKEIWIDDSVKEDYYVICFISPHPLPYTRIRGFANFDEVSAIANELARRHGLKVVNKQT